MTLLRNIFLLFAKNKFSWTSKIISDTALWKSGKLFSYPRSQNWDCWFNCSSMPLWDHCSIKLLEKLFHLIVFITIPTSVFLLGSFNLTIDSSATHTDLSVPWCSHLQWLSPLYFSHLLPIQYPKELHCFHEFKYLSILQ